MSNLPNENSLLLWKFFVPKNKKISDVVHVRKVNLVNIHNIQKYLINAKKIKIKTR